MHGHGGVRSGERPREPPGAVGRIPTAPGHNRPMSRRPSPPHARTAAPAAAAAPRAATPRAPTATRQSPSARPARTAHRAATRPGGARTTRAAAVPGESEASGGGWARVFSVRAMVLGVVLLVAFSMLFPTVRAYLGQRAELDTLAAQVAAAEQQEEVLAADLDRWGTDAYVAAQARERLSYVLPGETAYRVIDPEVVVDVPALESQVPGVLSGPALPPGGAVAPWYATVWESVQLAGAARVPTQAETEAAEAVVAP